jgi:hypothetical protein
MIRFATAWVTRRIVDDRVPLLVDPRTSLDAALFVGAQYMVRLTGLARRRWGRGLALAILATIDWVARLAVEEPFILLFVASWRPV